MGFYNYKKYQKKKLSKEDILKEFHFSRFYLILHFKDFVFEETFIKDFNFSKAEIKKYSNKLNELGYLSYRRFTDLDEEYQQIEFKINVDRDKLWKSAATIYVITPDGKEYGRQVLTECMKKTKDNNAIYDFINKLNQDSKKYLATKKKTKLQEQNLDNIVLRTLDGIYYERESRAMINLKLEIKKQKLLSSGTDLVIDTKYELQLLEEIKNEREEYKGLYSHLTAIELEEVMNEVKEKDLIDKKEQKELSQTVQQMNNEGERDMLIMQGAKISKREKDKLFNKGLDFLNSL